jgi:hypothetical protein
VLPLAAYPVRHAAGDDGIEGAWRERVGQDVAVPPDHRRVGKPDSRPGQDRFVDVDGNHMRDTARQPSGQEAIATADIED